MTYPLPPRSRRGLIDFQVGEQVGEGSLSQVHYAPEKATGLKFALKIFNRNYLRSNRKDADVAMEEHCLRRLNHPAIAKLHASFSDEASHYLVLEWCPGGELWELVKDVGCSDRVARHYLGQVVEAVSYLRDAGVVHRDLKAENVLLGPRGTAKLVDFGSAKDLANPHIKGAGTRSFQKVLEDNVGTPNFMAPEVVKNKFSDHRSDTWSLGCMIWQVLTGLPPFGTNLLKIYDRALKAKLPIPPGISEAARDLIQRMVVLNPNARLGALEIRELRSHAFFRPLPPASEGGPGTRFEGMHRAAAPVPSLEELCLRTIGRGWDRLGDSASSHAALAEDSQLRSEARGAIARFRKAAERAAARQEARRRAEASGSGIPDDEVSSDDVGEESAGKT